MIRHPRIPLMGSRYALPIPPSLLIGFGLGLLLGLVVTGAIVIRMLGRWA